MPLSPGSAVASAGTALPEGAGTEGPGSAAAGVLGNWQFQQLPASHHVCCFAKEVMSLCLQEAQHCLPY